MRVVSWIGIGSGLAMLLLIFWLLPGSGAHGLAVARLVYGALALLVYVPLLSALARAHREGLGKRMHNLSEARPV